AGANNALFSGHFHFCFTLLFSARFLKALFFNHGYRSAEIRICRRRLAVSACFSLIMVDFSTDNS
ncbi:hypothetical protein, partial [Hungatella sp.]